MQLRSHAILVLAALAATAPTSSISPAAANPYETFIDVDSEDDLYDLQATGQIDDETLAELVDLIQGGVDLNRASREELYSLPNLTYGEVDAILEYRDLAGWINDPIDLVVGGVLTQEKLEAIAAFLVISDPSRALFSTSGWVRVQTRWSEEDEEAPPAALQVRLDTLNNLTAGFASTFSNNRLSDVRYDPEREALAADEPTGRANVPKFYLKWETERWGVIAGTYRIGFGQRLTFDNTSLYTPNGFYLDDKIIRESELVRRCRESAGELETSPCTGEAGNIYVSPDYSWRDGLLGVAVGLKQLELGTGSLQSYAFASYQPHSIYQYELFDPAMCEDPRALDDEACSAPPVYRRQDDPEEETSAFSFSTLPNLYAEMTAGGNVAYAINRRSHVGVTGYGADVSWLTDGLELDFQEWSRLPFGGPFGAVGVDAAYGVSMFDFFAEVTRSFDSMTDGGGGFGALGRWVTTFKKQNELEASLRYYDEKFKNPFARPIAAADEFEGLRARDEMGARLRYTARLAALLSLRSTADVWSATSDGTTDMLLDTRADVDITRQFGVGLWGKYQNKDLEQNGGGQCFETSTEEDELGEPVPCAGEKYQATGRLRFSPTSRYNVVAQYQHSLLADERYPDELRQDLSASLIARAKPWDRLRLRGRVRYLLEDIEDDTYLEESVWGYFDLAFRPRARDWLRLRYDVYVYLDDRESTGERVPSPEHWLSFGYESRF